MGLKVETKKTVTPIGHGKGKGLMESSSITKKPPVLLREDSKYMLEKLLSIITSDNYEDLSNHATEAMGETWLLLHFLGNMSVLLCFSSLQPTLF